MNMNIKFKLKKLKENNIKIWSDKGKIYYSGPKEEIDESLIGYLQQNKQQIIKYLEQNEINDREKPLTPTHNQMGLWIEQKVNPNSHNMHNVVAKIVGKNYTYEEIEIAILKVINRHNALKMVFNEVDGNMHIQIKEKASQMIYRKNLKKKSDIQLRRIIETDACQPFEYNGGMLFRVNIYETLLGFIVVFCAHHLITDAVSFNVIWNELEKILKSNKYGDFDILKPDNTYEDYIRWENNYVSSEKYYESLGFWKEILSENICPTTLPIIKSQINEGYSAGILKKWLSLEVSNDVKNRVSELGTTIYFFLLSILQYLIDSISPNDQEKNTIGIFSSNRFIMEKDYSDVVGYFSNLLPFPISINRKLSFEEYLRESTKKFYTLLEHQEMPYALLVKEINPHRKEDRNSFFNIVFDSLLFSDNTQDHKDGFNMYDINQGAGEFDLLIWVRKENGKLGFDFRYNANLFYGNQIESFYDSFNYLLHEILENPNVKLHDLPIVSYSEFDIIKQNSRNKLIADSTLDCCIGQYAVCNPLKRAVISEIDGARISYGEIESRALDIATFLRKKNVNRQDKVVVCLKKVKAFIPIVIAIWKLGAIYVPVDPLFPTQRKEKIFENVNPKLILCDETKKNNFGAYSYALVSDMENYKYSGKNDFEGASIDEIAYIIHTSGSTGSPKGVQIRHKSLINLLEYLSKYLEVTQFDIFSSLSPVTFDLSIAEMFLPLYCGAELIMVELDTVKDSNKLYHLIKSAGITVMHGTPSTFEILSDGCPQDKPFLRVAICAGEKFDIDLAKKMNQMSLNSYNMYGPAETTVFSTAYKFPKPCEMVSIGRPIANTKVLILNQYFQIMPCFIPGEIYIGGMGVLDSYCNMNYKFEYPEYKFMSGERWYKTGDWGYYLPDGNIMLIGRHDDQVKIRGHRIELLEITCTLKQIKNIKDASTIVYSKDEKIKNIVSFVVAHEIFEFETDTIKSYLMQCLPAYMIPNTIILVKNIPQNRSGKIDNQALIKIAEDYYRKCEETIIEKERSYNKTEKAIFKIWSEILGTTAISLKSNFFDLGGNSLLLSKVRNQIEKKIGKEIEMVKLFKYTTIQDLAEFIEKGEQKQNKRDMMDSIQKRNKYLKARNRTRE